MKRIQSAILGLGLVASLSFAGDKDFDVIMDLDSVASLGSYELIPAGPIVHCLNGSRDILGPDGRFRPDMSPPSEAFIFANPQVKLVEGNLEISVEAYLLRCLRTRGTDYKWFVIKPRWPGAGLVVRDWFFFKTYYDSYGTYTQSTAVLSNGVRDPSLSAKASLPLLSALKAKNRQELQAKGSTRATLKLFHTDGGSLKVASAGYYLLTIEINGNYVEVTDFETKF